MVKLFLVFFGFSITFVSCRKDAALWQISNLNGNRISVVGHGGMGSAYRYPTNTGPSLNEAIRQGVDGLEMDIRLSADSVLVMFHHNDMAASTFCDGLVEQLKWEEIGECSYTEKVLVHSPVLSADNYFSDVREGDASFYVFDLKQQDTTRVFCERFAAAVLRFINKHDLAGRCFLESPQPALLASLHKGSPSLRLFLYTDDHGEGLRLSSELGLYGITMDMAKITRKQVDLVHTAGLRVAVFNARTERLNAEAIGLSPDYIQTDRIAHLKEALQN